MGTQTSTDHVADSANGVAPAGVAHESDLTPELIERVSKLSRSGLIELSELIDDNLDDGELLDLSAIPQPSREEIQRRIDAIRRGETKTYTVEETLAYLDSLCRREAS